jgi:hypothetical protein
MRKKVWSRHQFRESLHGSRYKGWVGSEGA